MFTIKSTLPALALAATLMAASGASAEGIFRDTNCMFKSAMIQKGGEKTPTSVNDPRSSIKDQWCSPTARGERTAGNYYNNERVRKGNSAAYKNNQMAPAAGY